MARCLIAVLLFAAACAEAAPPTLETGSLESSLPGAIWPDDPALVTEVDCPDLDVALIAQSTVCTGVLDTEVVTVDVAIDEFGAATAQIREPLFVVVEAADALVAQLKNDLSIDAVRATCEGTVILAEPGRSLDCQAISSARSIAFRLTLTDDTGTWTLALTDD